MSASEQGPDVRLDWENLSIGVALSGGGFRASLHGLGALMYLVDAGLNQRVTSIVSVSGGSITNAFAYANCDFRSVHTEHFDAVAARLVHIITQRGLIWSWPMIVFLFVVGSVFALSLTALVSTWAGFWTTGMSWITLDRKSVV